MRLLLLFLFAFVSVLRADELAFETYSCGITVPEGEVWQRIPPQPLPTGDSGENFYRIVQPEENLYFAICVLNNVPAFDLNNEGVVSKALHTLSAFGLQSQPPKLVRGEQISYLQFLAKPPDLSSAKPGSSAKPDKSIICVARAFLHEKSLYLVLMSGPGDVDKADDKHFTRILDTFHFLDPSAEGPPLTASPFFTLYHRGSYICFGLAGLLATLFFIVVYATRRRRSF